MPINNDDVELQHAAWLVDVLLTIRRELDNPSAERVLIYAFARAGIKAKIEELKTCETRPTTS